MAIRIGRIEPQARTITSQTPGRRISRVGVVGETAQETGKALSDIGENLRRANLFVEKTRAQNDFDSKMLDIQTRALNETDLSKEKQKSYDEEINKAGRDSSKSISIPNEKSLFELEVESSSNITRTKVKNSFTKKIVEQGKIDLENYLTNKEDKFINAQSLGEKQSAILERDNKINEAFRSGYLTKKEANNQIKKLNKDWAASQLDHDISVNPALARENITAGNYDLTAKEEKAALTLANDLEKKRKAEADRISEANTQQTELDLYRGVVDGTKSIREINDAEARGTVGLPGGIREKVATDLRRLATKGEVATPEQKADSFVALQDRFTDMSFKEDISLDELAIFRNDVISAMAKGEIRDTVGEGWLKDTLEVLDENLRDEVEKRNPRAGWGALKFWVEGLNPEQKQQMKEKLGRELNERVSKGEDDVKAANDIIEEETKKFNPNRTLYEIGQVINTPIGDVKVTGFDTDGEPLVDSVK